MRQKVAATEKQVTPKKRIIIAIGQSGLEIVLLKKSLGERDDLLIIASPTYDEKTLEGLRGQVNGVTRFDIWVHGNVENGEHHFLSGQPGPKQITPPTKNLFKKLREIVGEETPLTNVNLWSCRGGAAAKDVKELGASSTLICHADENFNILTKTVLDKIITAKAETGRESFIDSCLRSPETVTFSYYPKIGGEVANHTARRSHTALTVDTELSKRLENEFEKFSSFLTREGLPKDGLLATKLSAAAIKEYQEGDIALSLHRKDPERMLEYFLAKDSSGNKKFNLDKKTIAEMLSFASEHGHKRSVDVLIDHGAANDVINFKNHAGIPPLMYASFNGYIGIVEKLISSGADVNFSNDAGTTSLIFASLNGYTDIVKKLISSGANVDSRNGFRSSALALAAEMNRKESVELLIEHGANVNFRDNDGNTALILASRNGNADIVEKLLSGGANVSIAGDNGMTALSYVLKRGEKDPIYKMLKASLDGPGVVNTQKERLASLSSSIIDAPRESITAEKNRIYEKTNPSLDEAKVDTKQHRSASQNSLIVGTSIGAPSTSITAMAATAFFVVAAAALLMWKRKCGHADQDRPGTKVENPLAEQPKKGVKRDKPKGGKAL